MVQSKGTVLVTGGAQRIGKAICLALSEYGYKIALHYNRSQKEAEALARQIKKDGGICEIFHCDLADEQKTLSLINTVHKKLSKLNLLINNASIFEKSNLKTANINALTRHFDINFKAPFILSSQFAHLCKKGQIINILDTKISKNRTNYLSYLLSKKSLFELTKLSAIELAPDIRVNGVAPGLILPPTNKKTDYLQRLAENIPLRKKGMVKHITQSIQFLLENDYVTGQVIFEDGGEHL